MRSKDLEEWGAPELMRVKGPGVPPQKMGRMIDAYILNDKDDSTKWWSFFKQDGVSRSWSSDLQHWNYVGHAPAGENVCVIVDKGEYLMFDSPANGVGMQRSPDLRNWTDLGILKLGQATWPWASGRLTAAFVLDLRNETSIGKALPFINEFNEASGGVTNPSKIYLLSTREVSHIEVKAAIPNNWAKRVRVVPTAKYLGVTYGRDLTVRDVFAEAMGKLDQRVAASCP